MARINLTPKTKFVLPVGFNGENFDLPIDTEDLAFLSNIQKMADVMRSLGEEYQKEEKQACELDRAKDKACEELAKLFTEFCPKFGEITKNEKVTTMSVWVALISALSDMIAQTKLDQSVIDDIKAEESENV